MKREKALLTREAKDMQSHQLQMFAVVDVALALLLLEVTLIVHLPVYRGICQNAGIMDATRPSNAKVPEETVVVYHSLYQHQVPALAVIVVGVIHKRWNENHQWIRHIAEHPIFP